MSPDDRRSKSGRPSAEGLADLPIRQPSGTMDTPGEGSRERPARALDDAGPDDFGLDVTGSDGTALDDAGSEDAGEGANLDLFEDSGASSEPIEEVSVPHGSQMAFDGAVVGEPAYRDPGYGDPGHGESGRGEPAGPEVVGEDHTQPLEEEPSEEELEQGSEEPFRDLESPSAIDHLLGSVADALVHLAVLSIGGLAMVLLGLLPSLDQWPGFLSFLLLFSLLYFTLPLAFWGHSPGMAWRMLRARDRQGRPLTFGQTALRFCAAWLTVALAGLPLIAALTRATFADRLSGSTTVRRPPPSSAPSPLSHS